MAKSPETKFLDNEKWKALSREEKTTWYTLETLPPEILKIILQFTNIPEELRADLKRSGFSGFGWHIGSVEAEPNVDYTLVPSRDKGYGYGVFGNPKTVSIRFAGGKRYQREPKRIPLIPIPLDSDWHFKYSPRGDLVACSNGRAVLIEHVKTKNLTLEEAANLLGQNLEEREKIKREFESLFRNYQRHAEGFQLIWSDTYNLVSLEGDEADAIRNMKLGNNDDPIENMRLAAEYVRTKLTDS